MLTDRREYGFEGAHWLPHVPDGHQCGRMHGHSYRVWLHVAGPLDPAKDWVVDFAEIDRVFEHYRKLLDHHTLNEIEGLENPTSERLATWLAAKLRDPIARLAPGVRLVRVDVAETRRSLVKFVLPADG